VNTFVQLRLQIHLISGIEGRLPFTLEDASRADTDELAFEADGKAQQFSRVLLDTRLNNRVVDLRVCHPCAARSILLTLCQTQTNQAVFKLQSVIGDLFRQFLSSNGFIEIHSPKLQGAATESGASVFKVSYFKGKVTQLKPPTSQ
jgi:aspartyl/asparaginyl-tRNA synthetase